MDTVGFYAIDHHALLSLLEEVGYPLMSVAVNPVIFQLVHELSWSTVWNALLKPRTATSTWSLQSNSDIRSWMVTSSCDSQEYPRLKPCLRASTYHAYPGAPSHGGRWCAPVAISMIISNSVISPLTRLMCRFAALFYFSILLVNRSSRRGSFQSPRFSIEKGAQIAGSCESCNIILIHWFIVLGSKLIMPFIMFMQVYPTSNSVRPAQMAWYPWLGPSSPSKGYLTSTLTLRLSQNCRAKFINRSRV